MTLGVTAPLKSAQGGRMKTENSVKVLLPLGLHTPEMKEKIVEMLNGREGMFKGSVRRRKE